MKILKSIPIFVLILISFVLVGCNKKMFFQPNLNRDSYNTGGNLTFYYDSQAHVAYFGGEGEVVQYYETDIVKGWEQEGCRVGISLVLPQNLKDYKSATAKINGKELVSTDFIVEINEQIVLAVFQPIVSKENNLINLSINWAENSQPQNYKIIIKEGTIFMDNF